MEEDIEIKDRVKKDDQIQLVKGKDKLNTKQVAKDDNCGDEEQNKEYQVPNQDLIDNTNEELQPVKEKVRTCNDRRGLGKFARFVHGI